jgi:menaquinone-dependent protoporphyrinogen oxidase
MRILVTWGSKRGGTAGIGRIIAESLRESGHEVLGAPADEAPSPHGFDAVVVGSALYASRWQRDARRFVERHARALRRVPVWLFSSGPLDDSADRGEISPPRQVRALMDQVGALGHATFCGRLEADAHGFAAQAMAREHAGDWRNPARIRAWAGELAAALPTARPGAVGALHGRSLARLVAYGAVAWALCAGTLAALLATTSASVALVLHAMAAPLWFGALARRYQRADGARPPLTTALAWAAILAMLDAFLVASGPPSRFVMLGSFAGFWLPLLLAFLAAWAVGAIAAMLPVPAGARDQGLAPSQSGSR